MKKWLYNSLIMSSIIVINNAAFSVENCSYGCVNTTHGQCPAGSYLNTCGCGTGLGSASLYCDCATPNGSWQGNQEISLPVNCVGDIANSGGFVTCASTGKQLGYPTSSKCTNIPPSTGNATKKKNKFTSTHQK